MLTATLEVQFGPFAHTFPVSIPDNATEDEILALDGNTLTAEVSAAESADGILLSAQVNLPVLGEQTLSDDVPLNVLGKKIADWFLASGRSLTATLKVAKAPVAA